MPGEQFPNYIDLGGQLVHPQPVKIEGMRMFGFVFEAQPPSVGKGQLHLQQKLCDLALNSHPDRRFNYHALSSHFMVTFTDSQKLSSADQIGYVSELSTTFWLFTVAVRRGPVPIPERLALYVPYIFVDNQYSIVGGREAYGIRKSIGQFQIPADFTHVDSLTASTLAFQVFSPDTKAKNLQIVEVNRTDEAQTDEPLHQWDEPGALVTSLMNTMVGKEGQAALEGLEEAVDMSGLMPKVSVPLVFIKQFRDSEVGKKAIFQAIVEAPSRLLDVPKVGLLSGEYRLNVQHADSHPIDVDMGIPPAGLKAELAFWSELDFIIDTGKIIQSWPAPPENQGCLPFGHFLSRFF
jgi:hypothetical protein